MDKIKMWKVYKLNKIVAQNNKKRMIDFFLLSLIINKI